MCATMVIKVLFQVNIKQDHVHPRASWAKLGINLEHTFTICGKHVYTFMEMPETVEYL